MKNRRKSKNIYYDVITYDRLYEMWLIVQKTCKDKKALFLFSLNLNTNLLNLFSSLKDKTYCPSYYKTFMIFEPKPRLVMSQAIRDKIVNHFVTNYYLIPYLESKLIDTNVATRRGKGSGYANLLLKRYFHTLLTKYPDREIYCLKIDISKYFYSIDHDILIEKVKRYISDLEVIELLKLLIGQTNQEYINQNIEYYNQKYHTDIPYYKNKKGLSIGAMASQFFAIFYLNDLDHFIKETLKCKYYIRYMDDFLILDVDKEKLKYCFKAIRYELEKLKLHDNKKSNLYRASCGFVFLGYRYKVENNKLKISLYKKTLKKIRRRLTYLYETDRILYMRSSASYYGYFKVLGKKEKREFIMKLVEKYHVLKEKYPSEIILLKEGIFYKTFYDDAKILWYLFDYKYVGDCVSFGITPYDKVILKLQKLGIGFVVIDKDNEVFRIKKEKEDYSAYLSLALRSFKKDAIKQEILEKVKRVLDSTDQYEKLNKVLDEWVEQINV